MTVDMTSSSRCSLPTSTFWILYHVWILFCTVKWVLPFKTTTTRTTTKCATPTTSSCRLSAVSKKAEMFIKVKRLQQIVADGRPYQDYIDEQKRYGNDQVGKIDGSDQGCENNGASGEGRGGGDEEGDEGKEDDSLKGFDDSMKQAYRRAVAAGLIPKSADPVEVMKKVVQYQQARAIEKEREQVSRAGVVTEQHHHHHHHQQQQQHDQRTWRIAFLPDCGPLDDKRFFYRELCALFELDVNVGEKRRDPYLVGMDDRHGSLLPSVEGKKWEVDWSMLDMPYVYELNTKRFETKWMDYMRSLKLHAFDMVVGHGSSAEALLRYMESEPIRKCVLIDGSDIYTAGERHGRAYRYSLIADNCVSVRLLSVTEKGDKEASTLLTELKSRTKNGWLGLTHEKPEDVPGRIKEAILDELGM